MATRYFVWRRNDGYVSATAFMPQGWPGNTFVCLLETGDWNEAKGCIDANRAP